MSSSIIYKYLVVLMTFIGTGVLTAQVYDPERLDLMQPVYLDSLHHQLNLYDFSQNIAALLDDSREQIFLLGYHSSHLTGSFHLPFQAEQDHNNNFYFWSVYPISETDLFKGYFGYNYRIEDNVLWNDQAWNVETNPFLLGDSSLGDFKTTGLYWAAEWAHKFSSQWQSGFRFFYHVDQRVKDIFPKPFNDHLQYVINFSTQYTFSRMILGLNYGYISLQEKVRISRYNLDQNLTPIIFKFRYSDLPVILRGETSEEREMQMDGHNLSLQASYSLGNFTMMADGGIILRKSETFDGGTERLPEGKSDIEDRKAKFLIDYKQKFYLEYIFQDWFLEGSHPLYQDLTVIRRHLLNHYVRLGTKFNLMDIPIFLDLDYASHSDEMDDLMTINKWRFSRYSAGLYIGSMTSLFRRLTVTGWLGLRYDQVDPIQRTNNRYSVFFDVLYNDRLNYYLQKQNESRAGISVLYDYRPVFELETSFLFLKNKSELEMYRENWLFSLIFRLFVI